MALRILFPTEPIPRRRFWSIAPLVALGWVGLWFLPSFARMPSIVKLLIGSLGLALFTALADQIIQRFRDTGTPLAVLILQAVVALAGMVLVVIAGLASLAGLFGGTAPAWTGPVGITGVALCLTACASALVVCLQPSRTQGIE